MPVQWSTNAPPDGPSWRLSLWPYRSLLRRDFVLFMAATATLIALPLVSLLGTAVLWGLLPFLVLAVAGLWLAINASYKSGEVLEELSVNGDTAQLVRHEPKRPPQRWEANRHWISVCLHPTGGPVPNYITLRGGSREVELGAFLDEKERLALYDELKRALRPD